MRIEGASGRSLSVGEGRTRAMGVLNVTPDSFYDGGRHDQSIAAAVDHGLRLAADGADLIDVGGESTRPGHAPIPAAEQIRRVVPVVRELRQRLDLLISIDTTLAGVARAALDAGADWVNDTSALAADPGLAALCAERRCPVVLMHRFEPPRRAGDRPLGRELVAAIGSRLRARIAFATAAGIDEDRLVLDPGVGFGTIPEDNIAMHAFVDELRAIGRPLLFGTSRKSFLGHLTGRPVEQRLSGTAASITALALAGVEIVRVHDMAEMQDALRVADAIRTAIRTAGGRS